MESDNCCLVCYNDITYNVKLDCCNKNICLQCVTLIYDKSNQQVKCPNCRTKIINNKYEVEYERININNNNHLTENQIRLNNWFNCYYNKYYMYRYDVDIYDYNMERNLNIMIDIYEYAQLFNVPSSNNINIIYNLRYEFNDNDNKFLIYYAKSGLQQERIILYEFDVIVNYNFINFNDNDIDDDLKMLNLHDKDKLKKFISEKMISKKINVLKDLLCGDMFNEVEFKHINKFNKYKNCYYDYEFSLKKNSITITKYIDLKKFNIRYITNNKTLQIIAEMKNEGKSYWIFNDNNEHYEYLLMKINKLKPFIYNNFMKRNKEFIIKINKKKYEIIVDEQIIKLKYVVEGHEYFYSCLLNNIIKQ